jgi:hypothetical protein
MVPRVLLRLITGYAIDPTERDFTVNRRNCERWKKGLVELRHVILAHSIFLLALTGDIGPPVQFMPKHLKLADENDSILLCGKALLSPIKELDEVEVLERHTSLHLTVTVGLLAQKSPRQSLIPPFQDPTTSWTSQLHQIPFRHRFTL